MAIQCRVCVACDGKTHYDIACENVAVSILVVLMPLCIYIVKHGDC